MGNNYNDVRGTTKTNFKIGKLDIDANELTANNKLAFNANATAGSILQKTSTGKMSLVPLLPSSPQGILETTSQIYVNRPSGMASNGAKFNTLVNAPAPNTLNQINVAYSGSLDDMTVTVTPNDGTYNYASPTIATATGIGIQRVAYRPSDDTFYCIGGGTTSIVKISTTGTILSTWTSYGTSGNKIVYDSTQDALWIVEGSVSRVLKKIDANTGTQIGSTITLTRTGEISMVYESSTNSIWLGYGNGGLEKYDASLGTLSSSTILTTTIEDLDYDSTNNVLWSVGSGSGLIKISTSTGLITNTYSYGGLFAARNVKYISSTDEVWVGSTINEFDCVKVLNVVSGTFVTTISNLLQYTVGSSYLSSIRYNTANNTVVVGSQAESLIFNAATYSLIAISTYDLSISFIYWEYSPTSNLFVGACGISAIKKLGTDPNPVSLTSSEFSQIINGDTLTFKKVVITDPGSLRLYQTASGGDATLISNNGNGDNLSFYFYGGSDGVPGYPYQGGADGEIQFKNSTSFLSDPALFWDNTNKRLGIGTTSPAQPLSVVGLIESTTGGFKFPDGTTQTTAASGITLTTITGPATIGGTYTGDVYVNTNSGKVTLTSDVTIEGHLFVEGVNELGDWNGQTAKYSITVKKDIYLRDSAYIVLVGGYNLFSTGPEGGNLTCYGSIYGDGLSGIELDGASMDSSVSGTGSNSGNLVVYGNVSNIGIWLIGGNGGGLGGNGGDAGSLYVGGSATVWDIQVKGGNATGGGSTSGNVPNFTVRGSLDKFPTGGPSVGYQSILIAAGADNAGASCGVIADIFIGGSVNCQLNVNIGIISPSTINGIYLYGAVNGLVFNTSTISNLFVNKLLNRLEIIASILTNFNITDLSTTYSSISVNDWGAFYIGKCFIDTFVFTVTGTPSVAIKTEHFHCMNLVSNFTNQVYIDAAMGSADAIAVVEVYEHALGLQLQLFGTTENVSPIRKYIWDQSVSAWQYTASGALTLV